MMLWFEHCPTCGKTFHAVQRYDAERNLRLHMAKCVPADNQSRSTEA